MWLQASKSDGLNRTTMHNIVYQIWTLDSRESGQCTSSPRMEPADESASLRKGFIHMNNWPRMGRSNVENPAT